MGHGRRYCQVNTWCKFCITDTDATQACHKYEKFVKDNPIASSRRNTSGTGTRAESKCKSTRPTSTTIVPTSTCATLQPNGDTADSNAQLDTARGRARIQRTFSEITTKPDKGGTVPDVKTIPSSNELSGVRMDPRYQKPPQYADINHH